MIRLYDATFDYEISDEADLDEVLLTMDKIDESYKRREKIPSEFISIHIDSLYFAILYVIEKENDKAIKIIKDGIKFWEKFSEEQQEKIISELSIKLGNPNLMDQNIENWLESFTKTQKRYQQYL